MVIGSVELSTVSWGCEASMIVDFVDALRRNASFLFSVGLLALEFGCA